MKLLKPVIIAFAMYSRLPMPHVEWGEKNMRYAMCAFPLVGLVQGGVAFIWAWVCAKLQLSDIICAAGFTVLPLAINGGIHLDGLCDTADALASHSPKERRLEILKDPHIGAFGVISLACHLIMVVALFTDFSPSQLPQLACIYGISRCMSGFAVITFPSAKKEGTLHSFSQPAGKAAAGILAAGWLLLSGYLVWAYGLPGLLVAAAGLVMLGVYRFVAVHYFGGTTGDIAGWFLQNAELAMLAALVLGPKLITALA